MIQYLYEFGNSFNLTTANLLLLFIASVLLGMGKAGIKGIGVIIVIILALIFGSKNSTGILMPMLIIADVLAVIYYTKHTQWIYLKKLLPSMVVGVLIGVWIGNDIPEGLFKKYMAVLIIATLVIMILVENRKKIEVPTNRFFSNGMGLLSGITSMIGNLAGSFADIYFLAMRLPKDHFIGTAAWLFFIINIFKLPFHIFIWETITPKSLLLNLYVTPLIILGFFIGVYVVKLFSNAWYRKFIYVATAIGAFVILFK